MEHERTEQAGGWFVDPRNGRKVFWAVAAICALLTLAELFYHKHAELDWEGWFNFHGLYGFACYVFAVLAGRAWRRVVKREESYYDG